MKTGAKLIVFHPSLHKQNIIVSPRILLLIFASFFSFIFFLTLFSSGGSPAAGKISATTSDSNPLLPKSVFDALIHYATANSSSPEKMSPAEVNAVAGEIRRCGGGACNFLVFGLTHETLLWNSINHLGRTVFVDENSYIVSKLEQSNPEIEAYDVQFTTRVSELHDLIQHAWHLKETDCRPVQNLLFSECRLALNDLPNHIYDVVWDVILVDGPKGYSPAAPGRMSAIFTAGVLARSGGGGGGAASKTHVFVHEINREAERVSSEEFLCSGNLVNTVDNLGHFVVGKMSPESYRFCESPESSPAGFSPTYGNV